MDRLTSQDGRITAFRAGPGADLVVLHSLLADYAAFMQVLPQLAARHRVTLVNLPGFNDSAAVEGTPAAHVAFLEAAFDAFGVRAGATVLGNGFGGTLALAFALDRPQRSGQLILCDVAAGFPEEGKQAFRIMAGKVAADGMGAIAERIPGATLTMLPACGHCPPLEAPAVFLAAVSKALA